MEPYILVISDVMLVSLNMKVTLAGATLVMNENFEVSTFSAEPNCEIADFLIVPLKYHYKKACCACNLF